MGEAKKILAYVPNFLPSYAAGDTVMLYEILAYLLNKGHECTVMLPRAVEPYNYKGIAVIPRSSSAFRHADLIMTQLDCTKETIQLGAGRPIIWVQHNTFPYGSIESNPHIGVIYNGEASRKAMGWANDGFVLPPPVNYLNWQRTNGDCITLVNCNENKGGKILAKIAQSMPHKQFIAVKGAYGEQHAPDLPNVHVLDHTNNMQAVYNCTRVLIMPSLYESWGRVATEAMSCGIPVIATPTFGLVENIGESGIFVQRENIQGWMDAINKLDGKKEYKAASEAATKRAIELHPGKKLEGMEKWVTKFVQKHKEKNGIQSGIRHHQH